jgi:hypothetical protein
MVQSIPVNSLTLKDLRDRFGLQWVQDCNFFPEWHGPFPALSAAEMSLLDQTREGFFNLLDYPPLLEHVVRI